MGATSSLAFAGVTISLIVAVPLGCSVTAAEVQVTVTGLPAPVQVQPGSVPVVAVKAKLLGRWSTTVIALVVAPVPTLVTTIEPEAPR